MRWIAFQLLEKSVLAGDAYFCCHEFKKIGHLAMEVRWFERSIVIIFHKMASSAHCLSSCWLKTEVFVINLAH